jgi:hypothetical protein
MVGVHKGTGLFDLLSAGNFQLIKENPSPLISLVTQG